MAKPSKRILSIKLKRMVDTSPDTSHLGEYSNHATSIYSIDRAHSADCQSLEANHGDAVNKLERILAHVMAWRRDCADNADNTEWESLDESADTLAGLQDTLAECDCGEHGDMGRHEYRYFNPSFNYVGKDGKPADGLTPEEVRKYTRQDYERMERLNAGDWCYLGVRVEASVQTQPGGTVQCVTSGGLWGIESDSERSYFAEVQAEELANLRAELLAIGFSTRSVFLAFKNVEGVSE